MLPNWSVTGRIIVGSIVETDGRYLVTVIDKSGDVDIPITYIRDTWEDVLTLLRPLVG